jgi:hypothetical protein
VRRGVVVGRLDGGHRLRRLRVEQAQADAPGEQAHQRAVDHRLRQQALADGVDDGLDFGRHAVAVVAADQVHAGLEARRHGFLRRSGVVQAVRTVDIGRAAAVGHHEALEAPGAA